MTNRREHRKRAYDYIIAQGKRLKLDLSSRLDKTICGDYWISLNDLLQLKEGLADPPEQLVFALKHLLKGAASEAEIDEYLVRPFRPRR